MTFRITDSYLSSIMVGDLNRSLGSVLRQQRMAITMRRVNSYADDPRSVGLIQRYKSLIANNDSYLRNVDRSRILVDSTDVALQDISEVLADVRVIAMRESSALGTPSSMNTTVTEVSHLVDRLLAVLNTSVEGNYIFAGRSADRPPFIKTGNNVVYEGDNLEIFSRMGANYTMAVNIPGDVFMGSQSSTLAGGTDMAPRLIGTTPLSDFNLGDGWQPGAITISDGTNNTWTIDLTSAVTVLDALNMITSATGGAVTASISFDGTALQLNGTGPFTVTEDGDTNTAASLGLLGSSAGNPYTGRDIRPAPVASTQLSNIYSMWGKLPLGNVNVEWQGNNYTVNLSGATTIGDISNAFRTSVPGMEVEIDGSFLAVIGSSPELFTITDADSTKSASVLGIRGSGNPVRLFGMLEDLQSALASGDKDAVRGALNEILVLENSIQQLLLKNGGRQTDLDWAEGILGQRDVRLRSNLSLEWDADIARVASDLSRAEMSYQASLLVTSKLFQTNLMQFLR